MDDKDEVNGNKISAPGDDGAVKGRVVGEKEMYDKGEAERAEAAARHPENRPETDTRND